MEAKLFELRDRGTFIPALAVRLQSTDNREMWLLRRAGFSAGQILFGQELAMVHLSANRGTTDPYGFDERTWPVFHKFVVDNWDKLESGTLIDVEFILKETDAPKTSEQELDQ